MEKEEKEAPCVASVASQGGGFSVCVYHEDTDFSGFVYHGAYVHFLERARSEYLRHLGLSHQALRAGVFGTGLLFVVSALNLRFLGRACIEDRLEVQTRLQEVGGARLVVAQTILRGEKILVEAEVTLALVTEEGRVQRIPPLVRDAFLLG